MWYVYRLNESSHSFLCYNNEPRKRLQLEISEVIFKCFVVYKGKHVLSCMSTIERLVVEIKKDKRKKILFSHSKKRVFYSYPKPGIAYMIYLADQVSHRNILRKI